MPSMAEILFTVATLMVMVITIAAFLAVCAACYIAVVSFVLWLGDQMDKY